MQLTIGQKVAYPNQGVCLVEEIRQHKVGTQSMQGYALRVLSDNSTIFVPEANAKSVGLRPLISSSQCRKLIAKLSEDFEPVSWDWKARARTCTDKLRSGDVFQTAEVLQMLTFLSREKKLSFREQTLLEKAKFLIISEVTNTCPENAAMLPTDILSLVESACAKHLLTQPSVMSDAVH